MQLYYTIERAENMLAEADKYDSDIGTGWSDFMINPNYETLQKIFDEENYDHHDHWTDKFVEVDTAKAMKKILKGKDVAEMFQFVFAFGKLVGRAEKTLLDN